MCIKGVSEERAHRSGSLAGFCSEEQLLHGAARARGAAPRGAGSPSGARCVRAEHQHLPALLRPPGRGRPQWSASDPEWFVFELTVRAALRRGVGLQEATGGYRRAGRVWASRRLQVSRQGVGLQEATGEQAGRGPQEATGEQAGGAWVSRRLQVSRQGVGLQEATVCGPSASPLTACRWAGGSTVTDETGANEGRRR
ncbi:unnamed protein product [Arctogadus glacialis]